MSEQAVTHVRSVAKAMELLDILLSARAPMTLQQLAAASGYPKSTAHALLSTLRRYAVIAQDADGRYRLGIRLFEYGCAVSDSWDIPREAQPYLEELAAQTGGSAFLSLLSGSDAITVAQCVGGSGLRVTAEAGSRLPLNATSQGKLLLAQMSDAEALRRASEGGLRAYTPHTITQPDALLRALAEIRANGYAVEDGEYKIGLRSVSAPVYSGDGPAQYAIGTVGLFRNTRSDEFRRAVVSTTEIAGAFSSALARRRG